MVVSAQGGRMNSPTSRGIAHSYGRAHDHPAAIVFTGSFANIVVVPLLDPEVIFPQCTPLLLASHST